MPFINMEEVKSEIFQVLREPLRVRQRRALIEAEVIGSPTAPAGGGRSAYTAVVQTADQAAVSLQPLMIVCSGADQQLFRMEVCPGRDRQTQLDLIFDRRLFKGILFGKLSGSRRIDFI